MTATSLTRKPALPLDPPTVTWCSETAGIRIGLALASLVSLFVGVVAVIVEADTLRWVALLLFFWVGPGSAPWQLHARLGLAARLTLTAVTTFAVLFLPATVMVMTDNWHPVIAFWVLAVLAVPMHVLGLRRAWGEQVVRPGRWQDADWASPQTWGRRFAASPAPALAVVGALLCLLAMLTHRHLVPGFGGFLTQIGPGWYLGLVLLIAAIVLARRGTERQVALPVVLFLGVLMLTPSLVYDTPHGQSAYKHVELVQQLLTRNSLDAYIDVYDRWPALFAATAWICNVAGIENSLHLATFWPPLLIVLELAVLRYFFGQLLPTAFQCWIAVVLTVLADSLGQGYYSPQSVGLVLGIAIFALALSGLPDRLRLWLVLVAGVTMAVTHQLSPYVVGGALVVLAVAKMIRPWWTPVLVLGPAGLWTLLNLGVVSNFFSLGSLFRLGNFTTPTAGLPTEAVRLPIVGVTVWALVIGVLLLGIPALVSLVLHRRDRSAWGMAFASMVGFVLVATNPYGQEGLFRATLFALPWLAALAGRLVDPERSVRTRLPLAGLTVALTVTYLVSSFGLDAARVLRPGDAGAVEYFSQQGQPTPDRPYFLLYLGPGDQPTTLDTDHFSVSRNAIGVPVQSASALPNAEIVPALTANYIEYADARGSEFDAFAIWSPAASAFGDAYGVQTPEEYRDLLEAFLASPYWRVVYQEDGTYLFRLEQSRYALATQ
jgi:hypothetical protein